MIDNKMKKLILVMFLTFSLTSTFSQKFFNLNDTAFQIGEIYRADIIWDLSGRPQIHEQSYGIMDSIVDFLKKNKNISVEFDVFSFLKSNTSFANTFTIKRAEDLIDWCVYKGIDSNRLTYKAYTNIEPIIVDEETNKIYPFLKLGQVLDDKYINSLDSIEKRKCANKLNRRTEIKITKTWL